LLLPCRYFLIALPLLTASEYSSAVTNSCSLMKTCKLIHKSLCWKLHLQKCMLGRTFTCWLQWDSVKRLPREPVGCEWVK
jgi:hypothetical protein